VRWDLALSWITSLVATVVLGLVGIWATHREAERARTAASGDLEKSLTHERQMAAQALHQARIERAYLGLLEMTEKVSAWAQLVAPIVDTDPPREVPPLPTIEEQARAQANVSSFGSEDVRARLNEWREVVLKMVQLAGLAEIIRADASARGHIEGNPWVEMHALRPREIETRDALADAIRRELAAVE